MGRVMPRAKHRVEANPRIRPRTKGVRRLGIRSDMAPIHTVVWRCQSSVSPPPHLFFFFIVYLAKTIESHKHASRHTQGHMRGR